MIGSPSFDMLDLMRSGYHPMDLLGLNRDMIDKLKGCLSKLYARLDDAYGTPTCEAAAPV
jgi:hypothetical protein